MSIFEQLSPRACLNVSVPAMAVLCKLLCLKRMVRNHYARAYNEKEVLICLIKEIPWVLARGPRFISALGREEEE